MSLARMLEMKKGEPWQLDLFYKAINEKKTELTERRERLREKWAKTTPACRYKTIKAAIKDGWHAEKPDDYGGDRLLIKGELLVRNTSKAVSETEWKRRGFRVKGGEGAHGWITWRPGGAVTMTYGVYREDQVEKIEKATNVRARTATMDSLSIDAPRNSEGFFLRFVFTQGSD